MTEDSAGTDQRGARRPYIKPFLKNLDVVDTQNKEAVASGESTFVAPS
jgi:hypothetical protein